MRKISVIIFLVCISFFSNYSLAYSGNVVVLHITGIPGESVIDGHEGWIDILAFSWQMSNPDAGLTAPIVRPLIVTKYIDKASPFLTLAVLNGQFIQEAILIVRQAELGSIDYLKITMSNVQVANVSPGGTSGDDRILESVALAFSSVCYAYTPQKQDGSGDAEIERCFDIENNAPF
jgi:type VI secretion system secreted protein Hcp